LTESPAGLGSANNSRTSDRASVNRAARHAIASTWEKFNTTSPPILRSRCTQTQTPDYSGPPADFVKARTGRAGPIRCEPQAGQGPNSVEARGVASEEGRAKAAQARPSVIQEPHPMRRATKIVHLGLSAGGGVEGYVVL
jgi:hypothetical protein